MKKAFFVYLIVFSFTIGQKVLVAANIDSVVTWAYYQGWYEAARSYYHYTGNTLDSVITWSYNSGWYESGKTYYYYGAASQVDSTHSYTYFQGWYHSGRGYYFYTGAQLDSVYDYTYYQGWYFSNRSYYKYSGNCIDSITGYTYYQGWYESTRSRYYSQANCQIDSVYTSSYYQGWYDAAHAYYYYGSSSGIPSANANPDKLTISPNPSGDKIVLRYTDDIFSHTSGTKPAERIELYSISGERINIEPLADNASGCIHLDVQALKPSLYLIRIETKAGFIMQKFVKQ